MANLGPSSLWTDLHAAIARNCRAWGDGKDHHRACIAEIRAEDKPDVAAYIRAFNASADAVEAAKARGATP